VINGGPENSFPLLLLLLLLLLLVFSLLLLSSQDQTYKFST